MTPGAILDTLKAKGVRLTRDGGDLIATPKAALTDDLRALIRAHKPELLEAVGKAKPSPEDELRRFVAVVYANDSPEDQVEALRHALSDPEAARDFYGWRLSPAYDEFQKERIARALRQVAMFKATGTIH